MGTHLSPPQKNGGSSPHFSAHVLWRKCCIDQYATWYTKVSLGPGDTVLEGDPASLPLPPPKKKGWGHSPQFSAHVCCGEMAGLIKMPLGTEVDLGPGDTMLDGDPASSPEKRGTPPSVRPVSIVAKQSPISATAQHLLKQVLLSDFHPFYANVSH